MIKGIGRFEKEALLSAPTKYDSPFDMVKGIGRFEEEASLSDPKTYMNTSRGRKRR